MLQLVPSIFSWETKLSGYAGLLYERPVCVVSSKFRREKKSDINLRLVSSLCQWNKGYLSCSYFLMYLFKLHLLCLYVSARTIESIKCSTNAISMRLYRGHRSQSTIHECFICYLINKEDKLLWNLIWTCVSMLHILVW